MMRKNEEYIRQAMDRRLSALDASPECRARIRRRIMKEEEEMREIKGRRAMSVRVAAVFAAVLLIGSIAIAAAVNVFDLYGREYEAVGKLAPQSVLEDSKSVTVADEALGESTARITNGYYDGMTLVLGYTIENAGRVEVHTPSEEELAAAAVRTDVNSPYSFCDGAYFDREEERALLSEMEEAMEQGRAFGVKVYWMEEDGQYSGDEFIPMNFQDHFGTSSVRYAVGQTEEWLPQSMQQLDELPVRVTLQKCELMMYFDGEKLYVDSTTRKLSEEMQAVIPRAESQAVRYEGAGEYRGVKAKAVLELSHVLGELTLHSEEPIFGNAVQTPQIEISDARGNVFAGSFARDESRQVFRYVLYGNATCPEEIRVRIYETVYYGEYEMIPYGTEEQRSEVIYQTEFVLKKTD